LIYDENYEMDDKISYRELCEEIFLEELREDKKILEILKTSITISEQFNRRMMITKNIIKKMTEKIKKRGIMERGIIKNIIKGEPIGKYTSESFFDGTSIGNILHNLAKDVSQLLNNVFGKQRKFNVVYFDCKLHKEGIKTI